MQAHFSSKLKHVLSNERLSAYQLHLSQNGDLNLFSHYAWNMAHSESLYPILQLLEISLRNTISQNAQQQFGKADWLDGANIIQPRDKTLIGKAKETLKRNKKPLDPGRIIAELNFGFWTSLLDRRYEQILWPRLIKVCFPAMPKTIRTRRVLSKRFNRIRNLRNRVFHHEPIWYWQDLAQQHVDILEAIAWIEPAMRDLACAIDRFPDVYQQGLQEIEQKLKQFC